MQQQPWDASVKGLTAVPQVLAMMNDKLEWTQQVGEAFLAQPNDVSNAVQQLRAKAAANGNLKSSKQLKVSSVAASAPPPPPAPPPPDVGPAVLPPPPPVDYIMIEPVDPDLYYVPIYDPMVVYGPWPWPDYSPFYWYPPGYVLGAAVIGFGVGFFVGSALWCHYNWGGGGVAINVARYNQFNRTNLAATGGGLSKWQFNAAHRGTVGFQNPTLSPTVRLIGYARYFPEYAARQPLVDSQPRRNGTAGRKSQYKLEHQPKCERQPGFEYQPEPERKQKSERKQESERQPKRQFSYDEPKS